MQLMDIEELKKDIESESLNLKTDGSIDRKAVIDFLSGIANLDPKLEGALVMYVMSLPDVQPEQPTVKRRRGSGMRIIMEYMKIRVFHIPAISVVVAHLMECTAANILKKNGRSARTAGRTCGRRMNHESKS